MSNDGVNSISYMTYRLDHKIEKIIGLSEHLTFEEALKDAEDQAVSLVAKVCGDKRSKECFNFEIKDLNLESPDGYHLKKEKETVQIFEKKVSYLSGYVYGVTPKIEVEKIYTFGVCEKCMPSFISINTFDKKISDKKILSVKDVELLCTKDEEIHEMINIMEANIKQQACTLKENDLTLEEYETKIESLVNEIESISNNLDDVKTEANEYKNLVETSYETVYSQLKEAKATIDELKTTYESEDSQDTVVLDLKKTLKETEKVLKETEKVVKDQKEWIEDLEDEIDDINNDLDETKTTNTKLEKQLVREKSLFEEAQTIIKELNIKINKYKYDIDSLKEDLERFKKQPSTVTPTEFDHGNHVSYMIELKEKLKTTPTDRDVDVIEKNFKR